MTKKPAKKPAKTTTLPAWICPKCGATHPITVTTCCAPVQVYPMQPTHPMPFHPFEPWIVTCVTDANRSSNAQA